MVTPVHSDKLNIYNGILRVTTFKNICTKNTVKNSIDKWIWNSKICTSGPYKGKKKRTKNKNNREQTKQKIKIPDLSPAYQ